MALGRRLAWLSQGFWWWALWVKGLSKVLLLPGGPHRLSHTRTHWYSRRSRRLGARIDLLRRLLCILQGLWLIVIE